MFGKLNFGEVQAAPPDDGGTISMIRGAGLPRCWPSFPPALLEAGEEWLLGSFPWRIARASASRPSRVRRVASSMSMFGFMFMSSILLWGNVGQSGTYPFLSGRVGQALKTGRRVLLGGQRMRSFSASFTARLACKAPRTRTEAIVCRASSGVTSLAMLARPRTWMCSISPAACTASRSWRP